MNYGKDTNCNEERSRVYFWMVVGPLNSPKVRHYSFNDANKEAQRLAKINPGSEYFVVRSVAGWKIPQPGLVQVL